VRPSSLLTCSDRPSIATRSVPSRSRIRLLLVSPRGKKTLAGVHGTLRVPGDPQNSVDEATCLGTVKEGPVTIPPDHWGMIVDIGSVPQRRRWIPRSGTKAESAGCVAQFRAGLGDAGKPDCKLVTVGTLGKTRTVFVPSIKGAQPRPEQERSVTGGPVTSRICGRTLRADPPGVGRWIWWRQHDARRQGRLHDAEADAAGRSGGDPATPVG
jgi:hypothetical protein